MVNTNPLSGIPVNTLVDGWAYIRGSRIFTATNGNRYAAWEGLDSQGVVIKGTLFEAGHQPIPPLAQGEIWAVAGSIGEGRQGLQVWAKAMTQILDPVDCQQFKNICLPTVPPAELQMYISELKSYSQKIQDPELRKLSTALFSYLEPLLPTAPAARQNHEPLRGGLAKHTWEVISILNNQVLMNRGLDMDVLLFSALFHDMGKTREYTEDMSYAPEGRLIPHSAMALEFITKAITTLDIQVNPKTLRHVKHCIMAHHGEFGDIKPLTREAMAVHCADMMMSKLGHFEELIRVGGFSNDGWGTYSMVLQSAPYVPQLDNREV